MEAHSCEYKPSEAIQKIIDDKGVRDNVLEANINFLTNRDMDLTTYLEVMCLDASLDAMFDNLEDRGNWIDYKRLYDACIQFIEHLASIYATKPTSSLKHAIQDVACILRHYKL